MKILLLILVLVLPSIQPARAGGGGLTGATELTQIANNVQLGEAYLLQGLQYDQQLLQWAREIENMKAHSMGDISPQLNYLISSHARVMAASRDIGSTMARVDQDFAGQFQSPTAASFAERFRNWTTHSNDALKAAMLNAGAQRESFANDEAALAALVSKNQASTGNLGALKTLGEINAAQLQESMKLRDLISQQQIAQGTYLAARNSKEQARRDVEQQELDNTMPREIKPMPTPRQKSNTNW